MEKFSHGCTLDCADICKFNVYKENDKIRIEGDKLHPYTKGIICNKGRAHAERLNHKDRIYTPLLKVNGEWVEITFEKSLEILSEKLGYYKNQTKNKSMIYYTEYGSGSVLKDIGGIFFNFFGGINLSQGGPCWSAGMQAHSYDFGTSKSNSLDDLLNSKNIFVWGKNPANTSIHTMKAIIDAKKNGSRVIVIDPIQTDTAKMADIYIQVNSGSDGALAVCMAKIIIEKNLIDKDYIDNYVLGFNEYKMYLDTLDINELSEECGVSISKIEELVSLYTEKYSSILIGYGMQKYFNGGNNIRLIDSLATITGQIGYSGGGINYANKVYSNILNTDPYESFKYADNSYFEVSKFSEFLEKTDIKMIIITKSNMLNQLSNLNRLKENFRKIEFKVCFDLFMTDTAKECDLFIPCTNTLETEDLLFSSMTNPYLVYNEKVLNPKNELMDEYSYFYELAKRLNIENYPFVTKKEYLNKVIEPLKKYDENISLEKIRDTYFTIDKDIAFEDKIFMTPSKKIELYSKNAEQETGNGFPTYMKTIKNNKYRLLTNHSRESLSSQHMMDKSDKSCCYVNKNTLDNENLVEGEFIKLKSKDGEIEVFVKLNKGVKDGIILMYNGYWAKNSNPNYIVKSDISDMGGQITYNETFIDIIKQN
ncbi:MAG: molybdopterin-dependent oxidoreductase [Peptostreptococcaceae bacterium]